MYASGTTISARRNVCLYDSDATDVMQQWVVGGNETDGYILRSNASNAYTLHYSTGTDTGSCVGNADVKNEFGKAPTEYLVDFIYLGNNRVKIKRRNSNEYLTAYNSALLPQTPSQQKRQMEMFIGQPTALSATSRFGMLHLRLIMFPEYS